MAGTSAASNQSNNTLSTALINTVDKLMNELQISDDNSTGFDPQNTISAIMAKTDNVLGSKTTDLTAIITFIYVRGFNLNKVMGSMKPAGAASMTKLINCYNIKEKATKATDITLNRIMQAFAPMAMIIFCTRPEPGFIVSTVDWVVNGTSYMLPFGSPVTPTLILTTWKNDTKTKVLQCWAYSQIKQMEIMPSTRNLSIKDRKKRAEKFGRKMMASKHIKDEWKISAWNKCEINVDENGFSGPNVIDFMKKFSEYYITME